MSEFASEPVVDSAPTSTADVAANVIEAYESSDSEGIEVSGESPLPDETPAADTTPPVEVKLSEAEKLLQEAGYKTAKQLDGRDHRIPYSKVVKIIENGLAQGKGAFGEKYAAVESEARELRGRVDSFLAAVSGDPQAFIAEIAKADPRYQAFLAPSAPPPPAPSLDMPAPDLPLQDGSRTYSVEGIQKLIEWAVDAKMMPKVDERLKPLTEREQQERERAEQHQAAVTRTRAQIEDAKTWPGFSAHEQEILAALQEDSAQAKANGTRPKLSLEAAYRQVVVSRLVETDNQKRERLLKEVSAAPKSTAVQRSGGETPKFTGTPSTAEIASRVYDRLSKGA